MSKRSPRMDGNGYVPPEERTPLSEQDPNREPQNAVPPTRIDEPAHTQEESVTCPPKFPITIPQHWFSRPDCGETLTTLDLSNKDQSRWYARAGAGKSSRSDSMLNKTLAVVGFTFEPYQPPPDDDGELPAGRIGVHLHLANGTSVYCRPFHAWKDVVRLTVRNGMPSVDHPIDVVLEPYSFGGTNKSYRILSPDECD